MDTGHTGDSARPPDPQQQSVANVTTSPMNDSGNISRQSNTGVNRDVPNGSLSTRVLLQVDYPSHFLFFAFVFLNITGSVQKGGGSGEAPGLVAKVDKFSQLLKEISSGIGFSAYGVVCFCMCESRLSLKLTLTLGILCANARYSFLYC